MLTTKKDLALNKILPGIPLSFTIFTVMQGAEIQYLPESGTTLKGNFQVKGQHVEASLVHCGGCWRLTLFPRDSFTVKPVLDLFPNLAQFSWVSDVASLVSFKEGTELGSELPSFKQNRIHQDSVEKLRGFVSKLADCKC